MKKIKEFINKIYLFCLKHEKVVFYSAISIIFLLSFASRSIEAFNQNPLFTYDQGRDYLAAKSIVVDHKFTLIGSELGSGGAGLVGIFHGPFYYYLLTIPFILFNGNPTGGVYLMVVFSIFTLIAGYWLGNKMFGKWGGILVGLLIGVSPILIGEAKFLWNAHLAPFFVILTFLFLYNFLNSRKGIYILLAAFFAGFIYNFEIAVSIPLVMALGLFSIFLFKKNFKHYLYLILGLFLAFLPAIFFEIRHHFMALNGLLSYLTNHSQGSNISNSFFVSNHLRVIVDGFKESFPIINFSFSVVFLIWMILQSLILLIREKNENLKKMILLMLLLIPVNYIAFYFLKNWLWTYYLTDLTVAYIILFSYITYSVINRRYYKLGALLLMSITFLAVVGFNNSINDALRNYSDYGGNAKLKGKIAALDYIYTQANGKPFGMLVFSPPIYTYPYDYLIWWYGQRKYGYIPYSDKKGDMFLLIEVDHNQEWTYRGWLETYIRTGRIVKTVNLPSDFIVQERKFN